MMFLLDTNAFSDLMRKHPRFLSRLSTLAPTDRIVICPIVRGEIRYGIEQLSPGRRKQNLEKQAAPLFATITCEPIMASAADHYAAVKITMRRKGLALDENDLWIAATSLAMGAALITRDNDFKQIEGLSVQDWTA
jgi:tRNA(fMet)-specific endonuclease VapC